MAAIDDHTEVQACLDYSFYNLTDLSELEGEEPRVEDKKGRSNVSAKRTAEGKFAACNLKLNNNSLQELGTFMTALELVMHNPLQLTWVDLSFNTLTKIDPVLCDLTELKILYYHGNSVSDIREVDKLAGLPNLRKLSLHGNPIEKVKNYKCYVLCRIPLLKNFDMSTVTKNDRRNMETISKLQPMTTKGKKKKQMDA